MSALTKDNPSLPNRHVERVTRNAKATTTVFARSLVMKDAAGDIVSLSAAAGAFAGVAQNGVEAADTVRNVSVSRKGGFLAVISGVTKADLGKPVFCATDNPADVLGLCR